MFDSSKIYKMLKPDSSPDLITKLPVIIGGTTAVPDLINGAIIVHPLTPKPATSQTKDMYHDTTNQKEKGESLYELTYQIDIYKQNAKNVKHIEVEKEATTIQEWLKSFEIEEYLQTLDAEIYANYKPVRLMLNVEHNSTFTNRATFDFTIVSANQIFERINIIDKVVFDKTIILQGENTNE